MPMPAHTHRQPASPTSLGKEFMVFVERIEKQLAMLHDIAVPAKFGGATGNFNAHRAAYPGIDWVEFANRFVGELMEQLVQDGLLVTTKTRNGPGVRTATDAEISSPLPGQQQMTL